jgi:hypothetical protein
MSRLAIITFLAPGGGDVDNTLPGYGGRPDQGLPGGPVYPGQGLPPAGVGVWPGYGRPDNSLPGLPPQAIQLPVFPFDPTLGPDNELPDRPTVWPPQPGGKFVVKWLACHGLILVPDNSLPGNPAQPK